METAQQVKTRQRWGIAALATVLAMIGCHPTGGHTAPDAGAPDASTCATNPFSASCVCNTKEDCGATPGSCGPICTPTHKCVDICCADTDCSSGEVCDQSVCLPPATCDSSQENPCPSGECCMGARCQPCNTAKQVVTCAIVPASAILHAGTTKSFNLIAYNSDGNAFVVSLNPGDVSWTVDPAIGSGAVNATPSSVTVTGGSSSGSGTVAASIGDVSCTPAHVENYAAAPAGQFRVVVASLNSETPVSGATVVVNGSVQTSGSDGVAVFPGVTLPASISVFDDAYSYVTMIGVTDTDVAVFLPPQAPLSNLQGSMTTADFANLQNLAGTVHVAFAGASVPGNLFDLNLTNFLGSPVPTMISLGGSTATTANLPSGMVLGLGQQMYKSTFQVQSTPGLRTLWGLGGNVVLSDVLGVVSSATSGSVDLGAVLSAVVSVLGQLQSAVSVGVPVSAGQSANVHLNYDTLIRIQAIAMTPTLPTYLAAGNPERLNAALLLAGVRLPTQGFVPLGLSAGVDQNSGTSMDGMPDGVIDPATPGAPPGQVPLRFAPPHDDLEGAPNEAIAVALNTAALPGAHKTISAYSVRVVFPGPLTYANNATNQFSFGAAFLDIPADTAVDASTRTLAVSAPQGADFERLDLDGGWLVYFPPAMTSVSVPTPPPGFADRLSTSTTAQLRAISLKRNQGFDYQAAVQFNGENLDDVSADMDAYSTRTIAIAAGGQ